MHTTFRRPDQPVERTDSKSIIIETSFGKSATELSPVRMKVRYVADSRGVWVSGSLSTTVEVRIEQLQFIVFFHFPDDPRREHGRAFFAPGWNERLQDLQPWVKKCAGDSTSEYFYSPPWLDRRAMGWSHEGRGIWIVVPNACATRSRFQKTIGPFYHFDPERRGPNHNCHFVSMLVESQHHYTDCDWYTTPKNPYAVQERADITLRKDHWMLRPGDVKHYGPYLIVLTDTRDASDSDRAGFLLARSVGQQLRSTWPPSWSKLVTQKIRLDLEAPTLRDGSHYSVVLYNDRYWFSEQAHAAGPLDVDVFPDQQYRVAVIRCTDDLSDFRVVARPFAGDARALDPSRLYEIRVASDR
ncbi:MAG: hypothetical protein KDC95_21095 [Planctomycetes bacterium]|nr:hypothetical protein [Planctomycetota bacterium]